MNTQPEMLQTREQILEHAISNRRFLELLIERAQRDNENIPIYHAYGLGHEAFMYEFAITADSNITQDEMGDVLHGRVLPDTPNEYNTQDYLGDVNIGKHYNENYLFVNKAAAEAWVNFCRNDEGMVARRKAFNLEMDELDRIIEGDYDRFYDDRYEYEDEF